MDLLALRIGAYLGENRLMNYKYKIGDKVYYADWDTDPDELEAVTIFAIFADGYWVDNQGDNDRISEENLHKTKKEAKAYIKNADVPEPKRIQALSGADFLKSLGL